MIAMTYRPGIVRSLVLALVVSVLTLAGGGVQTTPGQAADLSRFHPGNIISDEVFFDGDAMNESAVESFIQVKGSSCRAGSDGTPCLKSFRQDTPDRPDDGRCAQYIGAPAERASRIIAKVASACGVSARVLLVMLQKEQSLVTNTGSSLRASRYGSAMGFGCPDTAACDARYYGFFNQVYSAARQFKNYAASPNSYGYRVGMVNQIRYSPTAACGSGRVFIENQATAGLYNFTPYQPNPAALAAGYGSGDGCSAYGNRNFFNYFNDWFGSTQSPGGAAIGEAVQAVGGVRVLGPAQSAVMCTLVRSGCGQAFARGSVYWTQRTGAHAVSGGVFSAYAAAGFERGLGYPTGDEMSTTDGVGRSQSFENGLLVWSASTGAHPLGGAIYAAWIQQGGARGALGYPIGPERPVSPGGRVQEFTGGRMYWTPSTGPVSSSGGIGNRYTRAGGPTGVLGYPIAEERDAPGGRIQSFQGGDIYWSARAGAQELAGAMRIRWWDSGGAAGPLGVPLTGEREEVGGGRSQVFSGGELWWSPATDVRLVRAGVVAAWAAVGGPRGTLGYPRGEESQTARGSGLQSFQGGVVHSEGAESFVVWGAIAMNWAANGGSEGPLGEPTGTENPVGPDGLWRQQSFLGGLVVWSPPTGAFPVWGAIGSSWADRGGVSSELGLPVSPEFPVPGGAAQRFQAGTLYWSGVTGVHAVAGGIYAAWDRLGGPGGTWGLPISDESTLEPGTVGQNFRGGTAVWSVERGALLASRATFEQWRADGGVNGAWGAQVGSTVSTAGGGGQTRYEKVTALESPTGIVTVLPGEGAPPR